MLEKKRKIINNDCKYFSLSGIILVILSILMKESFDLCVCLSVEDGQQNLQHLDTWKIWLGHTCQLSSILP